MGGREKGNSFSTRRQYLKFHINSTVHKMYNYAVLKIKTAL